MRMLSGELDYRIRYDVEHNLFHAQNVFNDEYIIPTFIEYVQNLEMENTELEQLKQEYIQTEKEYAELKIRYAELKAQIEKMKCCNNCKYKDLDYSFSPICISRGWDKIRGIDGNPLTFKCDKWEIKEK